MRSGAAWLTVASRLGLGLLTLTLVSGLLVPVYTDEVGWRFQLSRYLIDGLDRSMGETCGANTAAAPAWFMLPVRFFSSAVSVMHDDPVFIRLTGVTGALAGIAGLMWLIRCVAEGPGRAAAIQLVVCALLGLGVLPYLLVWSRPELPVWLTLLGASLLALGWPDKRSGAEPWMRVAGIVALAAVALSYHVKGVFYLPVFAVAIWLAGSGGRWPVVRVAATLVLAVIGHDGFRYWSERLSCPQDPEVLAKVANESLAARLLDGGVSEAFALLPTMAKQSLPDIYIAAIMPAGEHMSAWLPGATLSNGWMKLWRGLTDMGWYAALGFGLAWIAVGMVRRRRPRWPLLIMALTLAGCGTGWAALQVNKNAYESALYMPVMALALALALAAFDRMTRGLGVAAVALALASTVSQAMLLTHYPPRLWDAIKAGGYVAGQDFSISPYRYPRNMIAAAGRQCGLRPQDRYRRVLIDDLTYFTYVRGEAPMHRLGVLSEWNGSIDDPLVWMRRQASPGAVLRCAYLPTALRKRAIASGALCCFRTEWFEDKSREAGRPQPR